MGEQKIDDRDIDNDNLDQSSPLIYSKFLIEDLKSDTSYYEKHQPQIADFKPDSRTATSAPPDQKPVMDGFNCSSNSTS